MKRRFRMAQMLIMVFLLLKSMSLKVLGNTTNPRIILDDGMSSAFPQGILTFIFWVELLFNILSLLRFLPILIVLIIGIRIYIKKDIQNKLRKIIILIVATAVYLLQLFLWR